LRLEEPAADLAVAVAVASSLRDKPIPADLAFVGEVGLTGEVRSVAQLPTRLREAAKLGFRRVIVPKSLHVESGPAGLEVIPVRSVREALDRALAG
jgi:DNA repair protein RadA/Sms